MFFLLNIWLQLSVAPFPWQLVCLSSRQQNIASFAHCFFHLDYQGKQIVTENLLSATTIFGPERGSLFATFPLRTTRYFIIIRDTPRNELLTKKPVITLISKVTNLLEVTIYIFQFLTSITSFLWSLIDQVLDKPTREKSLRYCKDCKINQSIAMWR